MNRLLIGLCAIGCFLAGARASDEEQNRGTPTEFAFPEDLAGVLKKTLPPKVTLTAIAERAVAPRAKAGPGHVEQPSGLVTPAIDSVIRLAPLQPRGGQAPRLVVSEKPLENPPTPLPPLAVAFQVGGKTKVAKLDPGRPGDLPYLANFVSDRASLDDATRDMSLEAVLLAPIPSRQSPLPFARQSVPDPFENRRVVQFTHPGEEPSQPTTSKPQVP